ncbi:PREDICTED: heterogeneous nuclear ribonucleoprotein 1-like [Ipomoea nil]|uniref:heterogeneous nuclear ribonucleoprotein 1-like n=1 Tax=Ipomoea nil TaxID=35883 RepID=UPI0009011DCE|nr:PREDICTED: heterogeneous nuclear ribonucleoprotein 1-like [Ipomoea nil]
MEQQIKPFVGGLSHDTNEQTLRDYFSKYGEIKSSKTIRNRITGSGRGFGFIVFPDSSLVEHVLSDTHVILEKKVEVKVAKPKGSREAVLETRVKKIFVGGIPPDSTNEELKEHLEKYGTVEHAEIRRPMGFGFVTFESKEAAKTALRNRFQHMKNKTVEVKVAKVKPKVCLNNEEQNGNVAEEIDEIQDEIDGESVTNGEVQTQDEIDGKILTEAAISAGDSF